MRKKAAALQRCLVSSANSDCYYLRQDGPISVELPHAHNALIQEHDPFSLVRPQVLANVRVHHHVHHWQPRFIVLPLGQEKE